MVGVLDKGVGHGQVPARVGTNLILMCNLPDSLPCQDLDFSSESYSVARTGRHSLWTTPPPHATI